ncbi:MAG: hypothetical protein ACK4SX_00530 [Alcanivoracaceae bacterium]
MSDGEMQDINGAGIAVALQDFRFMMAPTSYMEQVGITPAGAAACTGTGSSASNTHCWRRGDLRWYGINISGAEPVAGSGSHWTENTCNPGVAAMNCPRGGVIGGAEGWFSPFDNPYIMRAWSPQGMSFDGALINTDPNNPTKTIYEYLAPTQQPDYIMSFWGEIEVGATRNPALQALTIGQGAANPAGGGLLKSQTIIRGNAAGSIFRMFKFTETAADPSYGQTFAMFYHSRLRGDFRFSVAQNSLYASDEIGTPVSFENIEGLHFRNVDAFLPFGQLYYQALVLDAVGTGGNFSLALTKVPNNPVVYQRFYSLNPGDNRGYTTALAAVRDWNIPCAVGNEACTNRRLSHGYVRYGDWYPGSAAWAPSSGTRNTAANVSDGIFFRKCPGCSDFRAFARRPIVIDKRGETFSRQRTQNYNCSTGNVGGCTVNSPNGGPVFSASAGDWSRTFPTSAVNLGDSRIEGLLIHHLTITSCQGGGC